MKNYQFSIQISPKYYDIFLTFLKKILSFDIELLDKLYNNKYTKGFLFFEDKNKCTIIDLARKKGLGSDMMKWVRAHKDLENFTEFGNGDWTDYAYIQENTHKRNNISFANNIIKFTKKDANRIVNLLEISLTHNIELLKEIYRDEITKGLLFFQHQENGTLIHTATKHSNIDVISFISQNFLQTYNDKTVTELFKLVLKNNSVETLKVLIENNIIDIDKYQNIDSKIDMIGTFSNGNTDIVDFLIKDCNITISKNTIKKAIRTGEINFLKRIIYEYSNQNIDLSECLYNTIIEFNEYQAKNSPFFINSINYLNVNGITLDIDNNTIRDLIVQARYHNPEIWDLIYYMINNDDKTIQIIKNIDWNSKNECKNIFKSTKFVIDCITNKYQEKILHAATPSKKEKVQDILKKTKHCLDQIIKIDLPNQNNIIEQKKIISTLWDFSNEDRGIDSMNTCFDHHGSLKKIIFKYSSLVTTIFAKIKTKNYPEKLCLKKLFLFSNFINILEFMDLEFIKALLIKFYNNLQKNNNKQESITDNDHDEDMSYNQEEEPIPNSEEDINEIHGWKHYDDEDMDLLGYST